MFREGNSAEALLVNQIEIVYCIFIFCLIPGFKAIIRA
jgi:hypothetical protein